MKLLILLGLAAVLAVSCAGQPSATSTPTDSTPTETSSTNSTASPSTPVSQAAETAVLRSGMFVDGEHPTEGDVRIVRDGNQTFLEFSENFKTDNGPALVVVLHRAADVIGSTTPPAFPLNEGDYVVLAPLQNVEGTQRYVIPSNLNLDDYLSAAVWCQQFNATFGAASLQS